jgi:hypothetical protein
MIYKLLKENRNLHIFYVFDRMKILNNKKDLLFLLIQSKLLSFEVKLRNQ